jgi:hypothetical protein
VPRIVERLAAAHASGADLLEVGRMLVDSDLEPTPELDAVAAA